MRPRIFDAGDSQQAQIADVVTQVRKDAPATYIALSKH
jgi:hypothetical protein